MKPENRQIEAFRKFLEKLPHGQDQDLVILKGHLLIEVQVRLIIEKKLSNPAALSKTKISCHQAICLAQSFFPQDHNTKFWEALIELNKIRNSIAHNIDPVGLQDKIDKFIKSIPIEWEASSKQQEFELMIWVLFVHVSSFVEGVMADGMDLFIPDVS